jgi:hypothetical protein
MGYRLYRRKFFANLRRLWGKNFGNIAPLYLYLKHLCTSTTLMRQSAFSKLFSLEFINSASLAVNQCIKKIKSKLYLFWKFLVVFKFCLDWQFSNIFQIPKKLQNNSICDLSFISITYVYENACSRKHFPISIVIQ